MIFKLSVILNPIAKIKTLLITNQINNTQFDYCFILVSVIHYQLLFSNNKGTDTSLIFPNVYPILRCGIKDLPEKVDGNAEHGRKSFRNKIS